jgi:hypothetical protein
MRAGWIFLGCGIISSEGGSDSHRVYVESKPSTRREPCGSEFGNGAWMIRSGFGVAGENIDRLAPA